MIKNNKNTSDKVVLITSRFWEGAYVLKKMIDQNLPVSDVLIQKTWWRDNNSYDYSKNYIKKLSDDLKEDRTFYTIEELSINTGLKVNYIPSINSKEALNLLKDINPSIMAVVGSKIIKPIILDEFKDKVINFHTGILPDFRGPYSEFWAIYENKVSCIGTTIHMIDEGIDTGDILGQVYVDIKEERNPQKAHIINAKVGAQLMGTCIHNYLNGKNNMITQDENKAKYYTFPTCNEIKNLEARLGMKIDLYYAD